MLNVKQAAEAIGISEEHVRRLARDRRLPGAKVGQAWRFPDDLAERLLRERETAPSAEAEREREPVAVGESR